MGEGGCAVFGVKKVPAAEARPDWVTMSRDKMAYYSLLLVLNVRVSTLVVVLGGSGLLA